MSDYADKNELYHWLKGKEKPGHKYTSRYMKNGKWYYVYGNKGSSKNLGDRIKDWWGVDELERLNKAAVKAGGALASERRERKYESSPGYTKIASVTETRRKPWDEVFTKGLRIKEEPKTTNYFRQDHVYLGGGRKRDAHDPENYNRQRVNAAWNAYKRAEADYYKTPMGKLDKAGTAIYNAAKKGSDWVKKKTSTLRTKIGRIGGKIGDSFEEHIGRKLAAYSKNKKKQKNQNRSRKKLKKNAVHGSRHTLDNNKKEISYAVYEKRPRPM